ncbi:SDR family oxidoreductase [Archangium violaceum]|nr:SDR family oxidoreductase [Archangium violaceum]QRK11312.1 SDR family oxidoreductase [Archangium violaceum]
MQVAETRKAPQPLPPPGEPRDVAAAVTFLASEEAASLTGATLLVDGGMALGGQGRGGVSNRSCCSTARRWAACSRSGWRTDTCR